MTNGEQIDAWLKRLNEPRRAEPKAPDADKYALDFMQGYNKVKHGAMPNNPYWLSQTGIAPRDAAILLLGGNPNPGRNGYVPSGTEELERVLASHNERNPARRTWREWYQVAKEIGELGADNEQYFDAFFASMEPPAIEEVAQPQAAALVPVVNRGTPKALTDAQEAEIVRLYDRGRGRSVNALAKQFSVSNPTIDKALKRADVKI